MLEAMAHGVVPVVTAASSGIAGVIQPHENGFVAPVGDMAAMAKTMAQLAGDQELLADVGQEAHRTAQAYSMDLYAEKFARILDQVAEVDVDVDYHKRYGIYSPPHPLLLQRQLMEQQRLETEVPDQRLVKRLLRGGLKRFRRSKSKSGSSNKQAA